MSKLLARLLLLSALLIVMHTASAASPMRSAFVSKPASRDAVVAAQAPQRVIVALRTDANPLLRSKSHALRSMAISTSRGRVLRSLTGEPVVLKRAFETVPAFAITAGPRALARLRSHPDVAAVGPDVGGGGHAVAPDEASTLNNVAGLAALNLDGRGMKVAVVDSGVDTDHPDIAPRLVAEQCFCSGGGCCPNRAASQSGAGAAEDEHGHGTNVAGIVMGQGIVAPRGAVPASQLVAVRVLDASNRFCCTSDIVAALDWIALNHPDVDVVNLSLGTDASYDGDCNAASASTQAMAQAVAGLTALGATVVASAGNQGNAYGMSSPACIADVISLAATWDFHGGARTFLGCTETGTAPRQPACFSNRSTTTDLYGAGAFVTAPGRGGGSSSYGGTSQAAPMAAACAVALRQAAPASTPAQRAEAMRLSATRVLDPVSGRRYGFLDCMDALHIVAPHVFGPTESQCSGVLLPPESLAAAAIPAAQSLQSPVATPERSRVGPKPTLRRPLN